MNVDIAGVKMAVVVQKMVQSEVAGIVYIVDPISQEKTKLNIVNTFQILFLKYC